MTDTKTRRGVRPLLALLLTGAALLMMGAARPVVAATASGYITVTTQGGTAAPDQVSWFASVTYSGNAFTVSMNYQYELVVEYCFSNGTTYTDTQLLSGTNPVHNSGGSPISAYGAFACNAGPAALAFMNQNPSIVGFRWHYHIEVDAIVNSTGANAASQLADSVTQTYGVWVAPPVTGPPPTDS